MKLLRRLKRFRKTHVEVPADQSPTGQVLYLRYVRMDRDTLTLHKPGVGYLKLSRLAHLDSPTAGAEPSGNTTVIDVAGTPDDLGEP